MLDIFGVLFTTFACPKVIKILSMLSFRSFGSFFFFYLSIDLESIFAYGVRNDLSPVSHGNIQFDLYMVSNSIDSFGLSIFRIKIPWWLGWFGKTNIIM